MSLKSIFKSVERRMFKVIRNKKTIFYVLTNTILISLASPIALWAEETMSTITTRSGEVAWVEALKAVAAAILLGWGAFGAALGISKFGTASLEGMSRQPEIQGKLFMTMLIGMAIIEALCLYCLVVALILII
ncbi:ATP synthase F0 subunit C [bacterium]|nr:ATP synthase F0 subunit C [bacterium]